jgi:hypothetical protein
MEVRDIWKFEMVAGCKTWRPWGCNGYLDRASAYKLMNLEQAKIPGQQMNVTKNETIKAYCIRWYCYTSVKYRNTPQFCLFSYPQDCNYSISHTIRHFNTMINKTAPKNKNFQFTASPTLMPLLVVNKVWCYNRVWLCMNIPTLWHCDTVTMPSDIWQENVNTSTKTVPSCLLSKNIVWNDENQMTVWGVEIMG